MSDLTVMQEGLVKYRHFSECIVEAVEWSDFGTTITITIDYIWNSDGSVRGDTNERLFVKLCFRIVQELELHNKLNRATLEDPSVINWSHAEIACVSVQDCGASARYARLPQPFYDVRFEREDSTWIRVVFGEMEMTEVQGQGC